MANMASGDQRLKIVKQYPFEFYDLIFLLYQTDQDELVVPIQNLCKVLGLNYGNQCRRVRQHEILSGHLYTVCANISPESGTARERDGLCISLDCLPYWLSWIDVRGTSKSDHGKSAKYQRDTVDALWLKHCFEILPDTLDVGE